MRNILLWCKYAIQLPVFLLVFVLRYPLAPIAVAFHRDYKLQWPFRWLDTIDNDLRGDEGWRTEHIKGSPADYLNMVRWVWRNGGNWANYHWLGCAEGEDYPLIRETYFGWLFVFIGWNTPGPQKGRCKMTLTIRIKR